MQSIFTNEEFFHYSDPLPTWIFDVSFYHSQNQDNILNKVIATSISLPEYKTSIVTKKFFGTEKSFAVLRKYGKDITMSFNLYADPNNNKEVNYITQINALKSNNQANETTRQMTEDEELDAMMNGTSLWDPSKGIYGTQVVTKKFTNILDYHPELTFRPNHSSSDWIRKFDMVEVKLRNKTGAVVYDIRFKHCVVTDFSFENDLNYDSDTRLRCKLTFHSDIWDIIKPEQSETEYDPVGDLSNEGAPLVSALEARLDNKKINNIKNFCEPNGNVKAENCTSFNN